GNMAPARPYSLRSHNCQRCMVRRARRRSHLPRRVARHGQGRTGGDMSAAAAKLKVEGLFKRFGGLTAVRDVSFSIHAGEILGLIGPNGSGKSTVMKSILGVERPDAGSVRVDGREVAGWPPHRIARLGVGMVFQHSRPLYRQTVIENIILGLLPDRLVDVLPDAAAGA